MGVHDYDIRLLLRELVFRDPQVALDALSRQYDDGRALLEAYRRPSLAIACEILAIVSERPNNATDIQACCRRVGIDAGRLAVLKTIKLSRERRALVSYRRGCIRLGRALDAESRSNWFGDSYYSDHLGAAARYFVYVYAFGWALSYDEAEKYLLGRLQAFRDMALAPGAIVGERSRLSLPAK